MAKASNKKAARDSVREIPLKSDTPLLEEVLEILRECVYFRTMNADFLRHLLEGGVFMEVEEGTLLIREGATDADIFILLDGIAGVYSNNKAILKLTEPGDIIGEFALVSAAPRSADVRADTPAQLVRVSAASVRDASADPREAAQFLGAFTHIMAVKLRETSLKARLYEDAVKKVREMASSQTELEGEIQDRLQEVLLYSKVVELSSDPVLITDTEGSVQRANAQAAKVFGKSIKKIASHRITDLLEGFNLGGYELGATPLPWHGEWSTGMEDKHIVFRTSVSSIFGSDGGTIAISYQLRDISKERAQERAIALKNEEIRKALTDLEQTYEELQRSDRLKMESLTVISNELGNPIRKILNHANKLIDQFSDPLQPKVITHLNAIQDQSTFLRAIATNIDHLIDLQEDMVTTTEQALNLSTVVDEVCAELQIKAGRRNIKLTKQLPEEPITLAGDPQQFNVMLNLLLEQALMVARPNSEMVIDGYVMDITEQVHLEVRYTGPSLMNMPVRLKGEDQMSLLIGLPLARKVISRHQGSIQFLRDGPITRIWILIPRTQKEGSDRPNRIIIADEREMDRMIVRGVIEHLWPGSVILETEDPFELLENYEDFRPDLVIADPEVTEPGWGNHRMIASLMQDRRHNCPLLSVSGLYQDFAERAIAIERGVTDFLSKPFSIFDVQFKIETLIQAHRKEESLTENMDLAQRQAFTDGLTKLANRKSFDGFMATQVNYSKQTDKPCSLIMIDVDNFKHYNDTNGHQLGDEVLKGVARVLSTSVRSSDLPARYGGEEFAIVLPETRKEMAVVIADKVRRALMETDFPNAKSQPLGFVSASLGVATCTEDGDTVEALIKAADDCLYVAKDTGRNRVVRAPADQQPEPEASGPVAEAESAIP